jgi:PKD repeat protein
VLAFIELSCIVMCEVVCMVETEDGFRRYIPGPTGDVVSGYSVPWAMGEDFYLAAGASHVTTLTIDDPDYVYYIDSINIAASAYVSITILANINDTSYAVATAMGSHDFPFRNNPSIYCLDGDHIDITTYNNDATGRGFSVRVHGSKIARPSNFNRGPIPFFALVPAQGPVGTTVYFVDVSTGNPTSWSWDFGDGSPKEYTENAVHTYDTVGSYDIIHTAENEYDDDICIGLNAINITDFEDFSTYSEYDPDGYLTRYANAIVWTLISNTALALVYKDFGVSYFGNIDLSCEFHLTAGNPSSDFCVLGFANWTTGFGIMVGPQIGVTVSRNAGGTYTITLFYAVDGVIATSSSLTASIFFYSYCRLVRASGSTHAYLYIYAEAAHTTLIDTLHINNAGVATAFRYFIPAQSQTAGTGGSESGVLNNVLFA